MIPAKFTEAVKQAGLLTIIWVQNVACDCVNNDRVINVSAQTFCLVSTRLKTEIQASLCQSNDQFSAILKSKNRVRNKQVFKPPLCNQTDIRTLAPTHVGICVLSDCQHQYKRNKFEKERKVE